MNSPEIPPRVFKNIPPRDFSNSERPRTPQAAPEMPVARSAPSGATPNRPSNERAATTGPNGGECNQGDQLLPTGKRIVVDPCSQQPKHLYVPQDQLRHKAPTAERYIHSLSGCRQVVNGVCIDPDMKWPDSQSGGPIYVKP